LAGSFASTTRVPWAAVFAALLGWGCSSGSAAIARDTGVDAGVDAGVKSGGDAGAGGDDSAASHGPVQVVVSPATATVMAGGSTTFVASVTGTTNTSVQWSASGGTISASGVFTAPATGATYVVTATSVADPTASGTAQVTVTGASDEPLDPPYDQRDGLIGRILAPLWGQTFALPAKILFVPFAFDSGNNAPTRIDYFVGSQKIDECTHNITASDYDYQCWVPSSYFPAAGTYTLSANAVGQMSTITLPPVLINVVAPAADAMPDLTADVVLSGSTDWTCQGTESMHKTLNANNHSIKAADGWTGHLTISYCDVRELGPEDIVDKSSQSWSLTEVPGLSVTVNGSGSVQIDHSTFERWAGIYITANDSSTVDFSYNTLQENSLVYSGQWQFYSNFGVHFAGSSASPKTFRGNRIGMAPVAFERASNWTIGGNTDGDGNVLIGPRCGITQTQTSNMVVRGNYSHSQYLGQWSQGENFFFDTGGGTGILVEHNLVRSGSWLVRGLASEFRYNVVVAYGEFHAFVDGPYDGALIHHNIFADNSESLYYPESSVKIAAYSDQPLQSTKVQITNNTFDGGGMADNLRGPVVFIDGTTPASLALFQGNAVYQYESTMPAVSGSLAAADYNLFFSPDSKATAEYDMAPAGSGQHDLTSDPKFSQAAPKPYPIPEGQVWAGAIGITAVLQTYRALYTPAPGSPLLTNAAPGGEFIGAVGAGSSTDRFGMLGP
jgi:hypothetical protein